MDPRRRDALAALNEAAFLLERQHAESHRPQALRTAAGVIAGLTDDDFVDRLEQGTLGQLRGIGRTTEAVVTAAGAGETSAYLAGLRQHAPPDAGPGEEIMAAVRGDLHSHSDWSDGGTAIDVMAETARALGRQYLALTDHSPRLTVARGLSRERLERQLEVVAELNKRWDDFRLLTGIEVDILDDGALDCDDDLLDRLDIVVASVHSKLRMPAREMTPRMVHALSHPAVTVLGHCTGRMTSGRGDRRRVRPPSEFDAELVFEAARHLGVAVEINARPERRDPPLQLMELALTMGCDFALDSDAHAPGQLAWLPLGAARAAEVGVPPERIITTWAMGDVLARRSAGAG